MDLDKWPITCVVMCVMNYAPECKKKNIYIMQLTKVKAYTQEDLVAGFALVEEHETK